MKNLLVGCPVRERAWILPTWMEHVEKACAFVEREPEYVFVTSSNDPSVDVIIDNAGERRIHWVWTEEVDEFSRDEPRWTHERYHRMVELRNLLLAKVQELEPDYFLSLDSDILLDEGGIKVLLEGMDQFDAMGGKCFMTVGDSNFPSFAMLSPNGDGLLRYDFDYGPTPVDVVMGIKLLSPKTYNVEYRWDRQGEDIGFARAAKERELKFGWTGEVANKHCMAEWMLTTIDKRCGW